VDDRRFDAIARNLGSQASRRVALQGLVGGLLGAGLAQRAAAQGEVGTEGGCHPERCTKKVLGQRCTDKNGQPRNRKCCDGLKCQNKRGKCVFKNDHGGPGDYCRSDNDCNQRFFCKKAQCLPDQCRKK
jgi:hypothetical protein